MASATRGAEEEVFETADVAEDGLEQHSEAEIPNPTLSKTSNKVPDAEVVESFVPPQAAFEVFMGRTYAGAREDMSDVVGAAASSSSSAGGAVYEGEGYHRPPAGAPPPGEGGGEEWSGGGEVETAAGVRRGAGSGPRRRTGESPLQRLVRLREETAMLAEDLEEMSKARRTERAGGAEGAQEGEGEAAGGGYSLWSAMAKETEALKRQLALLSGDPRFKHIISSTPATGRDQDVLQQRLSEGVVKALENLREPAGDPAAEATAPQTAAAGGGNGSVTYELFLNEASEARRRFGPAGGGEGEGGGIPSAEARIAALEKALGGGGEGAAGVVDAGKAGEVAGPLAEVVASLEKRVSVLEPGRLDVLRQKAQLAKLELDALAKSRSASASGSTSSSSARGKKVEEAFATLENWQGIAAGLPALVDRLQALETLHLASASFAQRLEQVETGHTELEGVLKCTNEGLLDTRKSSAENVSIVNENVKALDRRLAGVGLTA